MWSSSSNKQQINYGAIPPEMGMFVVAPASFHQHQEPSTLNFDIPHSINSSSATLIPLFAATPCLATANISGDNDFLGSNYVKKHGILGYNCGASSLLQVGGGGGGSTSGAAGIGSSSSTTTATCQDCGNQAKKDCSHRRCRTCCKSRGFDCSTHVKSTWVPAARRRERQLIAGATAGGGGGGGGGGSSGHSISSNSKRHKLVATTSQTPTASHTSTSNTTPPGSFDTSSSHQGLCLDARLNESLPGQVRAPAVFKCVRVTAVDDGENEYAYQAVVKIGGHVFKGFLYDQGVEAGRDGFPDISDLHLGGGRNLGASSSSPILDPSHVHAVSSAGLLEANSSNFGNPMN